MKSIGIVGAGVAGLHLGLYLRQHDVDVTIYTNRSAEQVADGRILNSVAHMHVTREWEAELGVDHWEEDKYLYSTHYHYNAWSGDRFRGEFAAPARTVDYRIYLPRLMRDFEERGGRLELRELAATDIQALSEVHDLVVVSTGKGEIGALFPKRLEVSPYQAPQRKLAVGFWHGVQRREPNGVEISVVPGVGELLAIPMYSFSGPVTALLFESVPGGEQESLTDTRYEDDPEAYRRLTLEILERFHPSVFERVDPAAFRLQGDKDILQGAFAPIMREDYLRLPNGRFLLALGDVHMTVDPIQAQGANSAAHSARVVGQSIVEDQVFDQLFVEKVARRRAERLEAANAWVNIMIATQPPSAQIPVLFDAMARSQRLADEVTENFNFPVRQLDLLATPERVAAAIARTEPATV